MQTALVALAVAFLLTPHAMVLTGAFSISADLTTPAGVMVPAVVAGIVAPSFANQSAAYALALDQFSTLALRVNTTVPGATANVAFIVGSPTLIEPPTVAVSGTIGVSSYGEFSATLFCRGSGALQVDLEIIVDTGAAIEIVHLFIAATCSVDAVSCSGAPLYNCSGHGSCVSKTALTKKCVCSTYYEGVDCTGWMIPRVRATGVAFPSAAVCPGVPFVMDVKYGSTHTAFQGDIVSVGRFLPPTFTTRVSYDFAFLSNSRAIVPLTPLAAGSIDFTIVTPGVYVFAKVAVASGYLPLQLFVLQVPGWGPPCGTNCTSVPCVHGTCDPVSGACVCPSTQSYFGGRCEYGCARTSTLPASYGGELVDNTRRASESVDLLPAALLANCSSKFTSSWPGADSIWLSFVEFDINANLPVVIVDAAGGQYSYAGNQIPEPLVITGSSFTVKFLSSTFQPTMGFKLRYHSLGCPPGSFISTALNSAGVYAPQCQLCPPGSFSPVRDVTGECVLCAPGSYAASAGASACTVTSFGQYQDVSGAVAPKTCANGTFAGALAMSACLPCPVGFEGSAQGLAICSRCALDSYADEPGLATCKRCPAGTVALAFGASSLVDCGCAAGYFNANSSLGQPCEPCPVSAVCPGGSSRPLAAAGAWASTDAPFLMYRCVDATVCPGGPPGTCASLRRGTLCGDCPPDTAITSTGCRRCDPATRAAMPLMLIACVGVLAFVYHSANANENDNLRSTVGMGTSFGLWFQYLQVASLFQRFKVGWPSSVSRVLSAIAVANLNPTAFAPACSLPMSYETSLHLRLAIPLFVVAAIFLAHVLSVFHWAFVRLVGPKLVARFPHFSDLYASRTIIHSPTATGRQRLVAKITLAAASLLTRFRPMLVRRSVNAVLLFSEVFYIQLITSSFEVFSCMPNNHGVSSLVAEPSIRCGSAHWRTLLPASIASIVLYCVVLPLVYLLGVRRVQATESDMDEAHLLAWQTFSGLMFKYKRHLRWWLFVSLLRKLVLSVAITSFPSEPLVQAISAIIVLVTGLAAQFVVLPYRLRHHNLVEWVLMLANIMLLLFGLLFYTNRLSAFARSLTAIASLGALVTSTVFMACIGFKEVSWLLRDRPVTASSSLTQLFAKRHLQCDTALTSLFSELSISRVASFRLMSVADDDQLTSLSRVARTILVVQRQSADLSSQALKLWSARYTAVNLNASGALVMSRDDHTTVWTNESTLDGAIQSHLRVQSNPGTVVPILPSVRAREKSSRPAVAFESASSSAISGDLPPEMNETNATRRRSSSTVMLTTSAHGDNANGSLVLASPRFTRAQDPPRSRTVLPAARAETNYNGSSRHDSGTHDGGAAKSGQKRSSPSPVRTGVAAKGQTSRQTGPATSASARAPARPPQRGSADSASLED